MSIIKLFFLKANIVNKKKTSWKNKYNYISQVQKIINFFGWTIPLRLRDLKAVIKAANKDLKKVEINKRKLSKSISRQPLA